MIPVDPANPPADAPALVLASTSPRRRLLLAAHGYAARVEPAPVEELAVDWLSVRELVLLNAGRKTAARVARETTGGGVVLGVDTLVCLDGAALGKPADLAEAAGMLGRLAGRTHQVYSGVCLTDAATRRTVCFVEETWVTFQSLDAGEIDAYLRLVNPLDKAGGYAAQEHGERIIARYEGSWSNVMGLPMETLANTLAREFAIRPVRTAKRADHG